MATNLNISIDGLRYQLSLCVNVYNKLQKLYGEDNTTLQLMSRRIAELETEISERTQGEHNEA